jgi:hypothetical protein
VRTVKFAVDGANSDSQPFGYHHLLPTLSATPVTALACWLANTRRQTRD